MWHPLFITCSCNVFWICIALPILLDVFKAAPLMLSLKWPENTPLVWLETPIKFVDGLKHCHTTNKVTDKAIWVLQEKQVKDNVWKAKEQRQETLAKAKATAEAQSVEEEVLLHRYLSATYHHDAGRNHSLEWLESSEVSKVASID
jgi:phage protein D